MILTFLQIVLLNLIGLILGYASIEDMRYRIIGKWKVVYIYILTICFITVTGAIGLQEVSITFVIIFVVFMVFSIISRGGFGLGDAFVISAVSWVCLSIGDIRHFFLPLGIVTLIWAVLWTIRLYKKNGHGHFVDSFKQKQIINVSRLRPGMVLAHDMFMHGLTEKDIDDLKKQGLETVIIKQPLPYIPCILIAYLVFFFM